MEARRNRTRQQISGVAAALLHDLILVEVKKPEESKYPWDYYKILATIPGETAFPPPDPEACALAKQ